MEIARLTSKGQMTIPKKVREAVRLKTGDVVTFEVEDDRVLMRKLAPGRDEYVKAVERTLTEWTSPEDEAAWRDL
jgi:AbrB family looped-hinge helix DNA binding protein